MRIYYQCICSYFTCTVIFISAQFSPATIAEELLESQIASQAIGRSVEYAILFTDGYHDTDESYPLVLLLHGAGGTQDCLAKASTMFRVNSFWGS